MQYRRLGRTNLKVSAIAYGGLPTVFQPPDVVIEAINYAIDQGVNYFDLDEGGNQFASDKVYLDGASKIGQVLKARRGDCYLGVKSMRQTYEELKYDVDLALERLVKGTAREVIDIFQLAFLDSPEKVKLVLSKRGGLRALEEAREEGKIDFILATAHNPKTLLQAMETGRFDVIEFPFNIIENEYLQKVMPLAEKMDLGTVVMKPVGGGQLAGLYDLSLRWILQHEVDCVIPGMRNIDEVKKNVVFGSHAEPLAEEEFARLEKLGKEVGAEYCHRCGYCMPCPQGIIIVGVMDLMRGQMLSLDMKKRSFNEVLKKRMKSDPAKCEQCGQCVEKCPFKLPIPSLMQRAVEIFNED